MIAITEIKHLIFPALYTALNKNDGELFAIAEKQTLDFIALNRAMKRSLFEVTVVDRPAEFDVLIEPFAWILQYSCIEQISGLSPEAELRARNKYADALKLLSNFHYKNEHIHNRSLRRHHGNTNDLYIRDFGVNSRYPGYSWIDTEVL